MIFVSRDKERRLKGHLVATTTHWYNELVYYHDGIDCDLYINGKTHKIHAGMLASIPAGVPHYEQHYAKGTVSYIGFSSQVNLPLGIYENMDQLAPLFAKITTERREQAPFFVKSSELYLELLCTLVLREKEKHHLATKNLDYAKSFIELNFTANVSLSVLASHIGYSEDRFRQLFTIQFGITPQKMITKLRLEKAIELLTKTDISCTEIAQRCGFYDSSQFSRMFSAEYGLSPKQFRSNKPD